MLKRYVQLSTRYLLFLTQKHLKLFFLKNPCVLEIHAKIFIEEMIQYLEFASKYSSGKRRMCEFSLNQIDEVVVVEVKVKYPWHDLLFFLLCIRMTLFIRNFKGTSNSTCIWKLKYGFSHTKKTSNNSDFTGEKVFLFHVKAWYITPQCQGPKFLLSYSFPIPMVVSWTSRSQMQYHITFQPTRKKRGREYAIPFKSAT